MAEVIALRPVGMDSSSLLAQIGESVGRVLGTGFRVGRSLLLPPTALNPQRGQYLALDILMALARCQRAGEKVLGVTEVDLYAPRLSFIFGQAAPGMGVAVISLSRLGGDEEPLLERSVKEAVHELGHLYGLGHCRRAYCVMFFSTILADTNGKGAGFCPTCARRLALGAEI